MAFGAYSYDIASKIKFNNNYGRLYFTDETLAVTAVNQVNTHMIPGAQMQLGKKLVSYDKRSLPAANLKDSVRARMSFYNSVDNTKQMTLSIPAYKPILKADNKTVDVKLTTDNLYSDADALVAAGLSMADGTVMDQVLSVSISKLQDITQQDAASTSQTP